jgi:hypothetical protein
MYRGVQGIGGEMEARRLVCSLPSPAICRRLLCSRLYVLAELCHNRDGSDCEVTKPLVVTRIFVFDFHPSLSSFVRESFQMVSLMFDLKRF